TDTGALRIGWSGPSTHTAESLLAVPHDNEDRGAVQEGVEVLRTLLEGGPRPAKTVKSEARRTGVSDVTLRRAKSLLGVRSVRTRLVLVSTFVLWPRAAKPS